MSDYQESNIRVLEGLEAVRVRPGMYIGTTGIEGLHQLVYEVVDNSIDEVLANRADKVDIIINEDESVEITDNGSGIPVEKHHQTGLSTLETVLTILHAGGKFDSSAYQYSGGLHGVGISVVNALSEWLEAYVKRNNKEYKMTFSRGKTVDKIKVIGDAKETGTKIIFKPDSEIFEVLEFDSDMLSKRFKEMAFLNEGVKINFEDKRSGKKTQFHYEGGIAEFVKELNNKKDPLFDEVVHLTGEKDQVLVDIAFQYTDSYNEMVLPFANTIHTGEEIGRAHV